MAIKIPQEVPKKPQGFGVEVPGVSANPNAVPGMPNQGGMIKPGKVGLKNNATKLGAKSNLNATQPGLNTAQPGTETPGAPDPAKMQTALKSANNVQSIMKMDDASWKKLLAQFGVFDG